MKKSEFEKELRDILFKNGYSIVVEAVKVVQQIEPLDSDEPIYYVYGEFGIVLREKLEDVPVEKEEL